MDIEVTSVSRTAETLSSAAAAISVVTNEDIRRSGATTIPEALRGVPGPARRTTQLEFVGGELARVQQHQHREAARAERLAQHLHAAPLRRHVGRAGLSAAGHRAHRSDSRSRREPVGRERGQWRDQHHDQARAQHAGHAAQRDGRHGRAAARPCATAASSANRASFACSASTRTATRRSIRVRQRRMTGASAMRAFAPTGTRAAATR